jgi:hypothetical protein
MMPRLKDDMKTWLTVIAFAVVATGCTTVKVTEFTSVTEQVGRTPELNQASEATVGSTVFSQFRYWSKTGYRLIDPVTTNVMLSTINVAPGEFVLPSEADGTKAFCTERLAYIDPLAGPWKPVCFVDSAKNGTFDIAKVAPGAVWFKNDIKPAARYEKGELIVPRPDAKKTELLYQGYSGKTVKLSYREYMNDFARPAFFQDVTYDVPEFPTTITFRTVRIKLLSADNNGLRYQVLSGF